MTMAVNKRRTRRDTQPMFPIEGPPSPKKNNAEIIKEALTDAKWAVKEARESMREVKDKEGVQKANEVIKKIREVEKHIHEKTN